MSTAKMYEYLTSLGYSGSINDMTNAYFTDLIANGGQPDSPKVGECVPDRELWVSSSASPLSSGRLCLVHFTARRSEAINTVTMWTGGTAAGATPTICRYGIYSVAANGDLTLVASTPNDTALWAAANTAYPKALSATWNKLAGRRYAAGILCVTAAAVPNFIGTTGTSLSHIGTTYLDAPTISSCVTGQADLPANVAVGSLTGFNIRHGMKLS